MEKRVQNEYSALLAYRWFFATYVKVLECKDVLRQRCIDNDGYVRIFPRHLNPEVHACFRCTLSFPEDESEPLVEIDYVMELFRNKHIECAITIHKEGSPAIEPSCVQKRIEEFCGRTFYVCKCGAQASERLEMRCIDCFTYWFKRTDGDVCPICLEDEGRWTQLGCRHILHTSCWRRTPGSRCPMCRLIHEPEEEINNYPFNSYL